MIENTVRLIRQNAFYLAWAVSVLGLVISVYVGEFLKIEPCHLCWYQRIALFPLALILGIGVYRDDTKIIPYMLPLTGIGFAVALYQTIGLKIPFLFSSATCGLADECANPVFNLFGFLTFPLLSSLGFAFIALLLFFAYKKN